MVHGLINDILVGKMDLLYPTRLSLDLRFLLLHLQLILTNLSTHLLNILGFLLITHLISYLSWFLLIFGSLNVSLVGVSFHQLVDRVLHHLR
jgi:uncharacterized membrane protein YuzA (DUF378 family)